jgi:hypothetical protein
VKLSSGFSFACWSSLALVLSPEVACAQNFDHPGQVFFNGQWGSREDATKAGFVAYGSRYYPAKLLPKLRGWEREDQQGDAGGDSYSMKSKHYQIRTDVPRHVMEHEIKPFLDALYETYVETFRERFGLEGKGTNFKSTRIYNGFGEYHRQTGRPRGNPGYIVNASDLHMLYEDVDPGPFYKTAFHEGAHQFFGGLMPGATLPTWLTEALATYFEACTYSRATRKVTFGSVPTDRLQFAKMQLAGKENPDPVAMFMSVQQPQYTALHYALGWSFLHFLIHTEQGKYGQRFGAVLKRLNGSGAKPFDEVFREIYGEELAVVAKGWRAHVMALEEPTERKRVLLQVGEVPAGVDLQTGDMLAQLNGVEIWASDQFQATWIALQEKQEPFEISVLRKRPIPEFPQEHELVEVRLTVRPEQVVMVYGNSYQGRMSCLSD